MFKLRMRIVLNETTVFFPFNLTYFSEYSSFTLFICGAAARDELIGGASRFHSVELHSTASDRIECNSKASVTLASIKKPLNFHRNNSEL